MPCEKKLLVGGGADLIYLAIEPDTEEETAGLTKYYQSTTAPLYMKFVTAFVYKKIEE